MVTIRVATKTTGAAWRNEEPPHFAASTVVPPISAPTRQRKSFVLRRLAPLICLLLLLPMMIVSGPKNVLDVYATRKNVQESVTPDITQKERFTVGDTSPPRNPPQKLKLGKFKQESAYPYLSQDIWAEIVDQRRSFFFRPQDANSITSDELRDWLRSQPHPVILVANNNLDQPWPTLDMQKNKTSYEIILKESNLHAIYAMNALALPKYPKLKPLPIGFKFQYRKRSLYGEPKGEILTRLAKVSKSPAETEALFRDSRRTLTVWLRPMGLTDQNPRYDKTLNLALSTPRSELASILNVTAPHRAVLGNNGTSLMTPDEYFETLKHHTFVISPAGNGLDSHSTWEALLAGCIPIIPKSSLASMYQDLPVWMVDDWREVTDEAMVTRAQGFHSRTDYRWDKVFSEGWKREFQEGLAAIQ